MLMHVTVTGDQYDWWFGWHSVETARYKLWNPIAHQYSYRTPYSTNWSNQTYAERYIGATSYIDEYVGNDAAKLSISFVDPESMGFNTTAWPELGIETIVIGKVLIGGNYRAAHTILPLLADFRLRNWTMH
jgi:hypothetical protein